MKKIISIILILTAMGITADPNSLPAQNISQSPETRNPAEGITVEAEEQRSLEAVMVFGSSLQAELQKALKEGGPENAITVCNAKANEIAMKVSAEQNLTLKRVSMKNRNPDNAPNEWQEKVLEEFESRKLKGEPVSELTYTDVAEIDSGKQFRFMKAIPTGSICIQCHGPDISTAVQKKLDRLYPGDKARGFLPGDIRGAFVVTRNFSS
jgi:hypothetical protein